MTRWYPNLTGKVDAEAELAIRRLYDHVYDLREMVKKGDRREGDVFVEEITLTPEEEQGAASETRRDRRRRQRRRRRSTDEGTQP